MSLPSSGPSTSGIAPAEPEATGGAATVMIQLDGKKVSAPLRQGETLLEIARHAGMAPPFFCEAGSRPPERMDHREFIPYLVWQRTANASRSLWSRTVLNEAGLATTVVGSGKRPTQTMARRVRYGFV